MKKISSEQIDQLFAFTKKHLVDFYDVQIELVDHLANAIEEQWIENPKISFEEALQKEYKKFGVFGFSGLVEQKQAALQKYYWKLIKKEIIGFFSVPKIIFTFLSFVGLYYFFDNPSEYMEIYSYAIFFVFIMLNISIIIYQKIKCKSDKKWLLQDTLNYLYSLPLLLIVYFQFGFITNGIAPSINAFITTLYIVFMLVLYTKIIPLVKKEVELTKQKFQYL